MADKSCVKVVYIMTACILSFVCSLVVLGFAIGYRFSDMGQSMGHLEDYPFYTFVWLVIGCVVGMLSSILGMFAAAMGQKDSAAGCFMQGTFGLCHLIAGITIAVFGFLVLDVANTDATEISNYCFRNEDIFRRRAKCVNSECNYKDTDVGRFDQSLMRTVGITDFRISNITSEFMCSEQCPCDITNLDADIQEKWNALAADEGKLADWDRCSKTIDPNCPDDKNLVLYDVSGG